MFTVPTLPVVIDWPALEYCHKGEDETKQRVDYYGGPDEAANLGPWKDAKVEEEEGKLQKRDLSEVKNLYGVEDMDEGRDLIEGNRPNILSESVGCKAVNCQHGAGYTRDECNCNEVIIEPEV
jgi:hypothetical protein